MAPGPPGELTPELYALSFQAPVSPWGLGGRLLPEGEYCKNGSRFLRPPEFPDH